MIKVREVVRSNRTSATVAGVRVLVGSGKLGRREIVISDLLFIKVEVGRILIE